jgi:hypothetical protein
MIDNVIVTKSIRLTPLLICQEIRSRLPVVQAEMTQMCVITLKDGRGPCLLVDGLAARGTFHEGGTHNFSLIHHSAIFWCEQHCHKSQP